MSATDRRSRMAAAASRRAEPDHETAGRTAVRSDAVRMTLILPPELYRAVMDWAASAADHLGEPRVKVPDAIRAMIRAGIADTTTGSPALAELRQQKRTR